MAQEIESFGKYVLLEKLASGGMAEVYLAKSTGAGGINKFVAIKRILPQYSDQPEFIDMFKEEAKIAVNLNHSNVVSIFDFGVEKGQFFLVMEYVEGQNLRQVLNHLKKENRNFSIDQIVFMIKEVAAGLDHAHRCLDGTTGKPLNITHRDMSPQNVMVSFEGELKVVDFGIAKAESQLETTRVGTIKGKFGYMSPEQADGQIVDQRTDIFSLGIVLWELLANDRLFASNSEAATLRKIRDCQIPSLKKINPSIPPELERIANKALAKDKSLRYQTASAFHRDLNRFLNTQYPEFSPQDFSLFMKSCFSQMFMSNRKKLIEYAKAQAAVEESTSGTSTQTDLGPHTETDAYEQEVMEKWNLSKTATPVDLSDLNKKVPTRKPSFYNENLERARPQGHTASRPALKKDSPFNLMNLATLAVVVMILAFGYLFWPSSKRKSADLPRVAEVTPTTMAPVVPTPPPTPTTTTLPVAQTQPEAVQGQSEMSSKALYTVIIQSTPSGARIAINGEDTGMITPAQRLVDAGTEFTLSLRKDGYQIYERRETAKQNGVVLQASLLPMPKMGYINLDIVNGGNSPVVIINGTRIAEKLPLRKYAVIAEAPIRIEAYNPFTGLAAEQTVTVGSNKRIQINLILSPRKPSQAQ